MIRGPDHIPETRFEFYSKYKKKHVLTINTLSCREGGEFGKFVTTPCVAKYRPNNLPEVHRLSLPEDLVRKYHPNEQGTADNE
jgi:hypothetical protein